MTNADVLLVESATLVALMVTVCAALTLAGAVYTALEPAVVRVPTAGLSDQVTVVSVLPLTDAVYDCLPLGFRVAPVGVIVTLTEAGAAIEAAERTGETAAVAAVMFM